MLQAVYPTGGDNIDSAILHKEKERIRYIENR